VSSASLQGTTLRSTNSLRPRSTFYVACLDSPARPGHGIAGCMDGRACWQQHRDSPWGTAAGHSTRDPTPPYIYPRAHPQSWGRARAFGLSFPGVLSFVCIWPLSSRDLYSLPPLETTCLPSFAILPSRLPVPHIIWLTRLSSPLLPLLFCYVQLN